MKTFASIALFCGSLTAGTITLATSTQCQWKGTGTPPSNPVINVTGTSQAVCPDNYFGRSAQASADGTNVTAYTDHGGPGFPAGTIASTQNVYDVSFFESGTGQGTLVLTLQDSWNLDDDLGFAAFGVSVSENGAALLSDGLQGVTGPPVSHGSKILTVTLPYELGTTRVFSIDEHALATNGAFSTINAALSVVDPPAEVPEPATWLLLTTGFGMMMLFIIVRALIN